jgi:hypothetical protein
MTGILFILTAALSLGVPQLLFADGPIPSAPYRFLHPPPALKRGNQQPASARRSYALKKGRTVAGFALFTTDTQAGLGAHPGAFSAGRPATQVATSIRPVEPPAAPLPAHLQLDGNAYRISVTARPGHAAVAVRQQLGIILRWPYAPHAVYVYTGGHWRLVCDAKHWQMQANFVICHTRLLGVFAVGHHPTSSSGKPR